MRTAALQRPTEALAGSCRPAAAAAPAAPPAPLRRPTRPPSSPLLQQPCRSSGRRQRLVVTSAAEPAQAAQQTAAAPAASGSSGGPEQEADVLIEFKNVWKSFGRCAGCLWHGMSNLVAAGQQAAHVVQQRPVPDSRAPCARPALVAARCWLAAAALHALRSAPTAPIAAAVETTSQPPSMPPRHQPLSATPHHPTSAPPSSLPFTCPVLQQADPAWRLVQDPAGRGSGYHRQQRHRQVDHAAAGGRPAAARQGGICSARGRARVSEKFRFEWGAERRCGWCW